MAVALDESFHFEGVRSLEKMTFLEILGADDVFTHGINIVYTVQLQYGDQFQQRIIGFFPVFVPAFFQAAVVYVHQNFLV